MSQLDDLLKAIDTTRSGDLRHEIENLRAIKAWAIQQTGIDYEPGDRVVIVSSRPSTTGRGWHHYREALAVGRTGVAGEITFSDFHDRWYVLVGMDRAWSVHDGPGGAIRYWKGPAELTPEGFTPPSKHDQEHHPDGQTQHFSMPLDWVKKFDVNDGGE